MTATIIEKWPNMSNLPDWANDAIEEGQLFNECFRRINTFKEALSDIKAITVNYDGYEDNIEGLKSVIDDIANIAEKASRLESWVETV